MNSSYEYLELQFVALGFHCGRCRRWFEWDELAAFDFRPRRFLCERCWQCAADFCAERESA